MFEAKEEKRPVLILFAGLFLAGALMAAPASVRAVSPYRSPYPEEPERYDSEYYLDMLTMRFDRDLRELWDGRDNAFRLAFGSLNVEQWGLFQYLKFSSRLSGSWRFRYWMERRGALNEEAGSLSEIELEFNFSKDLYLSFIIGPYFWKRDNDIGIAIQRRTAVDRYARLTFTALDFANNFAYRHGEDIEGEENLFTSQPLQLALRAREKAGKSLWFGVDASATTRWRKEYRFLDHPGADYDREGRMAKAEVWLEKGISSGVILDLDVEAAQYISFESGAPEGEETHRLIEFTPRIWWYPARYRVYPPPGISANEDGKGEEGILSPFSRGYFQSGRRRVGVCAGFQIRHETLDSEGVEGVDFTKDEVLPFILFKYAVSKSHALEAGYLADRYRSERSGGDSRKKWENRIKLAWELRFGGENLIRLIETIDLDREDWGQFSIHDHFFLITHIAF